MTLKALGLIVALSATGVLIIWIKHDSDIQSRKQAAARAVASLPTGVERQWLDYVDLKFEQNIKPKGDVIQVSTLGNMTTLVSRNSPYRINCFAGMALVHFGHGEDSISVPVYGFNYKKNDAIPHLGVDKHSIAAQRLDETLCMKISEKMRNVMDASPMQQNENPSA